MFKLIFKTISIIVILIIIIVTLAVWKGGESFRWIGEKIVMVGKAIEKIGDKVDGIKKGQKIAEEKLIELKKDFDSIQRNKQEQGTIDKRHKSK